MFFLTDKVNKVAMVSHGEQHNDDDAREGKLVLLFDSAMLSSSDMCLEFNGVTSFPMNQTSFMSYEEKK